MLLWRGLHRGGRKVIRNNMNKYKFYTALLSLFYLFPFYFVLSGADGDFWLFPNLRNPITAAVSSVTGIIFLWIIFAVFNAKGWIDQSYGFILFLIISTFLEFILLPLLVFFGLALIVGF